MFQPVAQTRKRLAWRDRALWSPTSSKSALVMAMQSSDSATVNRLISQYEMSKHLCDRLTYASSPGPSLVGAALSGELQTVLAVTCRMALAVIPERRVRRPGRQPLDRKHRPAGQSASS
jgi:hypothetical protein